MIKNINYRLTYENQITTKTQKNISYEPPGWAKYKLDIKWGANFTLSKLLPPEWFQASLDIHESITPSIMVKVVWYRFLAFRIIMFVFQWISTHLQLTIESKCQFYRQTPSPVGPCLLTCTCKGGVKTKYTVLSCNAI